ncbi:MAG: HAD family hydrolase [Candidatus Sumerlaeia bacterium]
MTHRLLDKYRYILWDWNGTLLDDVALCVGVMNTLLKRRGMDPLSIERYIEIFDFPVMEYYRKIGFDFEREPFEKTAIEFIEEHTKRRFDCGLHNDVETALQAAADRGMGQSILSATETQSLGEYVEHFGIHGFFEDMVGQGDHYAKGKIETGRQWMRKRGIAPESLVLVGDTVHDSEVAEALGIDCILIARGHHPRQKLETTQRPTFSAIAELFE